MGSPRDIDVFDPNKSPITKNPEILFHGRHTEPLNLNFKPAIISMLPMFVENANSFAMIAHSMRVLKSAVNPSQTPVIALDQPLFALAKQIHWTIAELSEANLVVMLGGLYIEMASLKMLGKWLSGSGWTELMQCWSSNTGGS